MQQSRQKVLFVGIVLVAVLGVAAVMYLLSRSDEDGGGAEASAQLVADSGMRGSGAPLATGIVAPAVRPERKSGPAPAELSITVDGAPAGNWDWATIRGVPARAEGHDVRDLASALLGGTQFRVSASGREDDNEPPRTQMVDLTDLDERDKLLIYPDGRGAYNLVHAHEYMTDEDKLELRELFAIEGVSALSFARRN